MWGDVRGRLFERRHQPRAEAKPGSSRGKGIPRHGKRRLWMEEGAHAVCVLRTGFWPRRRSCSHMVGTKASSKPATHKRHTFPHVGDKTWGKNSPPHYPRRRGEGRLPRSSAGVLPRGVPRGGPLRGGPQHAVVAQAAAHAFSWSWPCASQDVQVLAPALASVSVTEPAAQAIHSLSVVAAY